MSHSVSNPFSSLLSIQTFHLDSKIIVLLLASAYLQSVIFEI